MDNIIDYVTKTPANSNPNVLKDMLQNYSGGSSAIPDWDAEEGEEGFIKNRPFYRTIEKTAIYENESLGPWESDPSSSRIGIDMGEDIGYIPLTQLLEEKKISVIIDGEEYSNISYTIDTLNDSGNQTYHISDENEEVFEIECGYISSSDIYTLNFIGLYNQPNFKPEDTHGIAILEANETITTNYLPPIYWNMIVDPPSMGGGGGINTTSTGIGSHAEGMYTTSSNFGSHAEGYQTTASGHSSHAEGNTTQATGQYSHAEGYQTTANGDQSHTEGKNTTAKGQASHAEGIGTIALKKAQHVFGTYNEEDQSGNPNQNYPGTYIEIVGNGDNENSRSNARTLDWDGNEELAGNLTAKGGSITLGSTTITENQLQQLIALLNT